MKKVILAIIAFLACIVLIVYISLHYRTTPPELSVLINYDNVDQIDFSVLDSVTVAASTLYQANVLKEIIQGEQYRAVWETPITVPVFFLDRTLGGLQIVKEGGGKQTKSLRLRSADGILYTLRSINKDPQALVPEIAEQLALENIVTDGISAQHPYAAIPVAHLAEIIGILHTAPKVVFVPKQESLHSYNTEYGNKLYLFEYETKGETNWTNIKDVVSIIDTEDLIEMKMTQKKKISIDKSVLVKNRLFDLVIGDWDRHAKQWGWVIQTKDSLYKAIPLAGDRDNAFFKTDGIIPSIISHENVMEELESFEHTIAYLPGLVQRFDRYFLLDTPTTLFETEAKNIQKLLTDDRILEALQIWPSTIYQQDGKDIFEKIKTRRDSLQRYAIRFKEILDKKGVIHTPLKGCEDLKMNSRQLQCFECDAI